MMTRLANRLLLLAPLAACAATPSRAPSQAPSRAPAAGPAELAPEPDPGPAPSSLAELVRRYGAASGRPFSCDSFTAEMLEELAIEPVESDPRRLEIRSAASTLRSLEELALVQLEHAEADALARVLNELLGVGSTRVQADQRTNTLLLKGRPDQLEDLRALIAHLDRELPAAGPAEEAR